MITRFEVERVGRESFRFAALHEDLRLRSSGIHSYLHQSWQSGGGKKCLLGNCKPLLAIFLIAQVRPKRKKSFGFGKDIQGNFTWILRGAACIDCRSTGSVNRCASMSSCKLLSVKTPMNWPDSGGSKGGNLSCTKIYPHAYPVITQPNVVYSIEVCLWRNGIAV
jgi:hypothetical protein